MKGGQSTRNGKWARGGFGVEPDCACAGFRIVLAREEVGGIVVVLLTELPKIDGEDALREHINFSNSHVVVRTGDTAKAEDFETLSAKDARTVLVVSPADHTRDAAVARTLHVLLTMRRKNLDGISIRTSSSSQ